MNESGVHYRLSVLDAHAHLFEVECRVGVEAGEHSWSLPDWIPGSYMIRDFARHIVKLEACLDGQALAIEKRDKSSWYTRVEQAGELILTYQVYAWDLSVRGAHLDQTHGFFNGTSVFVSVAGTESQPHIMQLAASTELPNWQVATAMEPVSVDPSGYGSYRSNDYDELIDHPVEMGTFERLHFEACGVQHELVLTGLYHADLERVCRDLKKICEAQIRFFGEPAPMQRYVFLVMVVGDGYGGLEHRASTALVIGRDNLPIHGESGVSEAYLKFLGLCSHEYFHTWNVKRIRPAEFVPFDLSREVYTKQLWAFEGITRNGHSYCSTGCGFSFTIFYKRFYEIYPSV
ncbi:MAG: M61 family metallopeptidase [Granulosicoccaceae bacterium]